jgi:hypothetical protein
LGYPVFNIVTQLSARAGRQRCQALDAGLLSLSPQQAGAFHFGEPGSLDDRSGRAFKESILAASPQQGATVTEAAVERDQA